MPRPRPLPAPLTALHPPGTAGRLDGPALGFRVWKVTRDGRLRAITASHEWQPGPNQARACRRDHAAPGHGCHCGFNAFSDPHTLRSALHHTPHGWVAGAVAQWGATHAHMTGQRSEHAQIVALQRPDDPDTHAAADLAGARYQVPVIGTERGVVAVALEHAHPVADRHVPLEPLLLLAATAFRTDTPPPAGGPLDACALRLRRFRVAARMSDWALDHAFAACRGTGERLLWDVRACLLGCLNAAAGPDPWRTAHGEIERASRTLARGPLTFADIAPQGAPADGPRVPLGHLPHYDTRRARLLAACLRHHQHVDDGTISRLVDQAAVHSDVRVARRSIAERMLGARRLDVNRAAWLADTAACDLDTIVEHPGVSVLAALSTLARVHDHDPGALFADQRTARVLADPRAAKITTLRSRHLTDDIAGAAAQRIVHHHGTPNVHERTLVLAAETDDPTVAFVCVQELARRDPLLRDHVDVRRVAERHPGLAGLTVRLARGASIGGLPGAFDVIARDDLDTTAAASPETAGWTLRELAHVARDDRHPDQEAAAVAHDRLAERCARAGWTDERALRFARALHTPPDGPHRAAYMAGVHAGHHPAGQTQRLTDRELDDTIVVLLAGEPASPAAERALAATLAVISARRERVSGRTLRHARRRARELLEAPPITAALVEECRRLLQPGPDAGRAGSGGAAVSSG